MAAQAVAKPQRGLDIHALPRAVASEDGTLQRLVESVEGADGAFQRGDGLAAAIHGDAVAQGEEFRWQSRVNDQACVRARALEGDDLSDCLDDSSEQRGN